MLMAVIRGSYNTDPISTTTVGGGWMKRSKTPIEAPSYPATTPTAVVRGSRRERRNLLRIPVIGRHACVGERPPHYVATIFIPVGLKVRACRPIRNRKAAAGASPTLSHVSRPGLLYMIDPKRGGTRVTCYRLSSSAEIISSVGPVSRAGKTHPLADRPSCLPSPSGLEIGLKCSYISERQEVGARSLAG